MRPVLVGVRVVYFAGQLLGVGIDRVGPNPHAMAERGKGGGGGGTAYS